jgi:hypothetical protein
MAQYFAQVGNLGAFVSAHPHLNLTQREAVLLAHRLIQENVIEFVVPGIPVQDWDQPTTLAISHLRMRSITGC